MKILEIESANFEQASETNTIMVTVEGYPHAKPVFDASLTGAELRQALLDWKDNQDAVDEINRNATAPTRPQVKAKQAKQIKSEYSALIGLDITK